ncbi:RHS repeat domain-containing protein [Bdellovibrio bacteriovorus]|uniref:RHS repeat domain-containing protein n=1 Tax=Bdellovibrio bacteriovorus TaxID=959 RepID=UPI003AA7D252
MKIIMMLVMILGAGDWAQSASCEQERAEAIKSFHELSCTSDPVCQESPGYKSCMYYSAPMIVRYDEVNEKVYCTYTWTYDLWDSQNNPPSFPPVHDSGAGEVGIHVSPCISEPLAYPRRTSASGGGGGRGDSGPPGACQKSGSIVDVENQTLTEEVPVTGTFPMVYHSAYQKGISSDFKIRFIISESTPRDYIQSFNVVLKRGAATVDSASFLNSVANQTYEYTWNGLNASGTAPAISAEFMLRVSEVSPAGSYPNDYTIVLSHWNAKELGLGGWIPKPLKRYDSTSKRLYNAMGGYQLVVAQAYGSGSWLVPDSNGQVVYIFNSEGRHLYTKTGLLGGDIFSFQYNVNGQLTSILEPFGRVTTFNRNASGELISITAPNGQNSPINLDANGFIDSIVSPSSDTYEMSYYSSEGLLKTFEKPNGELSTFEYDSNGMITKDIHSGGYFFTLVKNLNSNFAYDVSTVSSLGRVAQVQTTVGSDGTVARTTISEKGLVGSSSFVPSSLSATRSDSNGGSSRSAVSVDDQRFGSAVRFPQSEIISLYGGTSSRNIDRTQNISLSDPSNPFSITAWQEASQLSGTNTQSTTVFNPSTQRFTTTTYLGKTSEWGIDTYERMISSKVGSLNQVSFIYTNENLTSITQGTRTTSLGYNTLGLIESISNPLSQTTSYVYNSANRVVSQVLPDSRVVGFSYDGVGNLTSVIPPGRPGHVLAINAHGLMGAYEPPGLSGVSVVNTTYTYNLDKQLMGIVRPDGSFVNYNYNAATGVLESVETPAGFYYHSMDTVVGLPSYISDPFGNGTQIGYFGRNPASYTVSNATGNFYYTPTFGAGNRLESDTVAGPMGAASTIAYLYNDDEDLRKAGDVNLTYNVPNGQLTGTTMGSGTTGFTDTYTYNNYGEVTGYQAKRGTTVIYDLTLNRDAMGRIDGKTQVMNAVTDNYVYTFDSTGRLTQTNKNSATVATYSYDSNSNRNGGTIGAQPTTATYDDQDRLLTYNTLLFTYNANGDLLTKTNSVTSTTTQYVYDVFGNLTQVTLPSGAVITYEIDALNRRTGKLVNGVVQKRWIYMDQYRIAAELNAAGTITKRFIYGSKGNIPDYMIASGVKYRIISDHLGSPRLVVKQSDGAVIQRMDHDEYGRVITDTNPGYLPFGFAGGLYDHQTSLVRFGARDYDSEVGRWTSKDPIQFEGGDTNLFGYVTGDPVNWIDTTGLHAVCDGVNCPVPSRIVPGGVGVISGSIGSTLAELCNPSSKKEKTCEQLRDEGYRICAERYREVHDGSQGKCFQQVTNDYIRCMKMK